MTLGRIAVSCGRATASVPPGCAPTTARAKPPTAVSGGVSQDSSWKCRRRCMAVHLLDLLGVSMYGLRTRVPLLAVVAAVAAQAPAPALAQTDPIEIIDRVDRMLRGDSSHGTMTMEVVTENWDRSMTMEVWSLGTDYSLVRVQAPRREAGTATLKAEDDIWNYLPKVDRSIKIPALDDGRRVDGLALHERRPREGEPAHRGLRTSRSPSRCEADGAAVWIRPHAEAGGPGGLGQHRVPHTAA